MNKSKPLPNSFPGVNHLVRLHLQCPTKDQNGNKAVQLFYAIPVAIAFLTVFRNSITIL